MEPSQRNDKRFRRRYANMMYKYYVFRPVGIGTYPKPGMIEYEKFENKTNVLVNGRYASGCLLFNRRLSEKESLDYDLVYGGEI